MRVINDKARHEHEILERLEVGIILTGAEAKSARAGQVDLKNAYVKILNTKSQEPNKDKNLKPNYQREFWVVNMQIYPYKYADPTDFKATRSRKLLLNKKEMLALESRMKQARLTIVPTAMYNKRGLIKLEIGLARGRRMYEKRERIKKRDSDRDVERALRDKDQ